MAIKGGRGRGETIYCAVVCAMEGESRAPKQMCSLQKRDLIRAHTMMKFTPERHLPTPGQHEHSPQRHTAATLNPGG